MVKYFSEHPELNVELKYSTPSEYIKAINEEGVVYPDKYDDFFPYADVDHGYWTGYFTSRVAVKGFVKQAGRYLQSVRTFLSLLNLHK